MNKKNIKESNIFTSKLQQAYDFIKRNIEDLSPAELVRAVSVKYEISNSKALDIYQNVKHKLAEQKKVKKIKEYKSMKIRKSDLKKVILEVLDEKHIGFKKLVKQLKAKGVKDENYDEEKLINPEEKDKEIEEDANALAAYIMRKKYSPKQITKMQQAGRKKAAKK